MINKNLAEKLNRELSCASIIENAHMADYTSFKCGGDAALLVVADNMESLSSAVKLVKAEGADCLILGNGTNTLFADGLYDGVVIKLGEAFSNIDIDEDTITAGAAASLIAAARLAQENSLTGLEFASGIPGSVGGGLFMNAGAYDGELKNCVSMVSSMDKDGNVKFYSNAELDLSYRHSIFMENDEIILAVSFELEPGDKTKIDELTRELTEKRTSRQPLSFPSAGSFFKRPEGHFAGKLIEDSGLKGASVGAAEVSTLHAGFIINKGGASASDIIALKKLVQDKVFKDSGVMLEPEVRIIGEA